MRQLSRQGLTSLELSIAMVIVAVLAACAFFYYKSAIEYTRMSDIVTLMNQEVTSQLRNKIAKNRYTRYWHQLDAQPVQMRRALADNKYANGTENTIYYSAGKENDGTPKNGFEVYFEEKGIDWFVVARRVGNGDYTYTLVRPFQEGKAYCLPAKNNAKDQKICMQFMKVDVPEKLLADPRQQG